METIWQVLVGAILGLAGSFLAQAAFQRVTRPEFEIQKVSGHGDQDHWFLQASVLNKPIAERRWWTDNWAGSCWIKAAFTRLIGADAQVAWATKARIRFSGQDLPEPLELWGRWAGAPQPVVPFQGNTDYITLPDPAALGIAPLNWLPDVSKIPLGERMDLMPGYNEYLDVAVKYNGEPSCWMFTNVSYFYKGRKPEWELRQGDYEVRIEIISGTVKAEKTFQLCNRGAGLKDFHWV